MKTKVIFTCRQFDNSGRGIKEIKKERIFENKQKAREFIELLKNRWRKIWGYKTKKNYWYANKTMAYVAFNKSSIQIEIKKA